MSSLKVKTDKTIFLHRTLYLYWIFFFFSASQNNYRIDANQELLAIGVTNIMGSFVSAYPVTGSFGRFVVM